MIRLSGYTDSRRWKSPSASWSRSRWSRPGLTDKNIEFTDDGHQALIQYYTREAGVRNLEREIGNVCRKIARKVVKAKARS